MSTAKDLKQSIKERLRDLATTYKPLLKADQKREAYIAKLKAFYKETGAGDTDRWTKLDQRVTDF